MYRRLTPSTSGSEPFCNQRTYGETKLVSLVARLGHKAASLLPQTIFGLATLPYFISV